MQPRMRIVAGHASASTSRRQRRISTTPGTMPLSRCWRSSLELTTLRPPLESSKRFIRSPAMAHLGNQVSQGKSRGSPPTGRERRLSCARDTGEAVQSTFLRSCYKLTCDDEPGVHGARGESCRPPTREGGISARDAAQSHVALVVLIGPVLTPPAASLVAENVIDVMKLHSIARESRQAPAAQS